MSRRGQIVMSAEELSDFLEAERTVTCATIGPDGWPHLMPLWYLVREGELWSWTYAKSQKVRNLERDDRATLQIEAGREYHELRGVMIAVNAVIHHDPEAVIELGLELFERYSGTAVGSPEIVATVETQAAKRVALQFVARRTVTWDHRKLGGLY